MQLIVFIKLFITLTLLTGAVTGHAAEDWHVFTLGQGNVSLAMDKSSLVIDGKKVSFWERVEFARPDQIDEVSGRLIKSKRIQRVMHCEARTQGVLRGSLFGENNKLIEAIIIDVDKVEMQPIAAGTVAEQQWAMVCARGQKTAQPAGMIPPLAPLPAIPTDARSTVDLRDPTTRP